MSELEADEDCSAERRRCSLFTHLIVSGLTVKHQPPGACRAWRAGDCLRRLILLGSFLFYFDLFLPE